VRVLHAPVNIAHCVKRMSQALRDSGYQSDVLILYPHNLSDYEYYDKCIDMVALSPPKFYLKSMSNLMDCLAKYDVFHFHFGKTLLPRNFDLSFIKAAGKKIVMHYWGSEVRRLSIASKRNKYAVTKNSEEIGIVKMLKRQSRFADAAIVGDFELYDHVDGFFQRVEVISAMLNVSDLRIRAPELNVAKPVIVHAPSNRRIKGTEFVLDAVKALRTEGYEFKLVLVEGVPYNEALKIYEGADIVIDQLRLGSCGMVSIEAMAMSKPVLCYIREDLVDKYPAGLPIVNTNPDNIYDNLKMLIENVELRIEIGKQGIEYTKRVHDSRKVIKQLVELYKSL